MKSKVLHTNDDLANIAGNVDHKGVIAFGSMNALHSETTAYGVQDTKKPAI